MNKSNKYIKYTVYFNNNKEIQKTIICYNGILMQLQTFNIFKPNKSPAFFYYPLCTNFKKVQMDSFIPILSYIILSLIILSLYNIIIHTSKPNLIYIKSLIILNIMKKRSQTTNQQTFNLSKSLHQTTKKKYS